MHCLIPKGEGLIREDSEENEYLPTIGLHVKSPGILLCGFCDGT